MNFNSIDNSIFAQGIVVWRKHTIPGEQPNIAHLYQKLSDKMGNNFVTMEPIDYYDCYYRNLYKYKMIGIFDLDEIIVPVKGYTLADLFNYTMVNYIEIQIE